jgi:hypothetical protein
MQPYPRGHPSSSFFFIFFQIFRALQYKTIYNMRLIPCLSIIYILLSFFSLSAQSSEKNYQIDRVDPPFWWTEMAEEEVELLVYGENIGECGVEMMAYDGVRLLAVQPVENPNYLFLSLRIEKGTQPGKLAFRFQPPAGAEASPPLPIPYTYPLARRDQSPTRNQGVTSEDFIYLLMPDRFANGNPENDIVEGMQQEIEPGAIYQRRGGDIAGIMEHLDYLKDLGVTTLWINPLLEKRSAPRVLPWLRLHRSLPDRPPLRQQC